MAESPSRILNSACTARDPNRAKPVEKGLVYQTCTPLNCISQRQIWHADTIYSWVYIQLNNRQVSMYLKGGVNVGRAIAIARFSASPVRVNTVCIIWHILVPQKTSLSWEVVMRILGSNCLWYHSKWRTILLQIQSSYLWYSLQFSIALRSDLDLSMMHGFLMAVSLHSKQFGWSPH